MNCQDFRELIDSYLSDELSTETNHGVLRHMEHCAQCRATTAAHRDFRGRLRSAIRNCGEFQISGDFDGRLRKTIRETASGRPATAGSFWNLRVSLAVAAVVLLVATASIFVVRSFERDNNRAALANPSAGNSYRQIALGDHKSCAVEHDLLEQPIGIDVSHPQFAMLRDTVQIPLQEKFGGCKLVESHNCRYRGRDFTHLVFKTGGGLMSVLIMDLSVEDGPVTDEIDRISMEGYQIAHFDVGQKAFFVISDLPEQENFAAAEIVESPLRERLSKNSQAELVPGRRLLIALPAIGSGLPYERF